MKRIKKFKETKDIRDERLWNEKFDKNYNISFGF